MHEKIYYIDKSITDHVRDGGRTDICGYIGSKVKAEEIYVNE